ncbi:hypothetical protein F2Q68_00026569 [Brassica cretica]|uniref:Uncharacterized protein n=1 Tax=Brassica cretica TaxID=69181 RepID=A0A8S9IKJ0_BRACR|nr:hypothetical protein F2Q68_00026569 [Brassica cretica]
MPSKLSNSLMKSYAVMSASSTANFIPPLTETFLNFSNCLCYLSSHSPSLVPWLSRSLSPSLALSAQCRLLCYYPPLTQCRSPSCSIDILPSVSSEDDILCCKSSATVFSCNSNIPGHDPVSASSCASAANASLLFLFVKVLDHFLIENGGIGYVLGGHGGDTMNVGSRRKGCLITTMEGINRGWTTGAATEMTGRVAECHGEESR